jgi:hypothetical protein
MRIRKKKLPKSYRRPDKHVNKDNDYSIWTDKSVPTPVNDTDPRMAEDSIDPDKPRGMWIK